MAARHIRLWDGAYTNFKRKNAALEAAYRELLFLEDAAPNSVSRKQPADKEQELAQLIQRKIDIMESKEWRIKLGNKSIKIRNQVDRILKTLLYVASSASVAANVDPVYSGLPIAGFYLVVSFFAGDKKNRDALFSGVERITDLVRKYAIVEDIYLNSIDLSYRTDLEAAILKLYELILDFEARALCHCSHNIASQTFRNLFAGGKWDDKIASIESADATCEALMQIVDREQQSNLTRQLLQVHHELKSQIDESVLKSQIQLKEMLEALEMSRKAQERTTEAIEQQHCLTALRNSDYDSLKNQLPSREKDTCKWFLQHPQYLEWLRTPTPALLWLTADPGCGKSILAKTLVEDFLDITGQTASVCYFFFKAGGEAESGTAALSALLHQLFSANPGLLKRHGLPIYRLNGEKLGSLFEPQWDIFRAVCCDDDRDPIICVLDALDECSNSQREMLVTRFARLMLEGVTNLRLLMTCRPDVRLLNAISSVLATNTFTFLQVEGDNERISGELAKEIDFVITRKIEQFRMTRKLRLINDQMHEELQQMVFQIQHRTYLWVSLIFDELQRNAGASQDDLRQILVTLPRTVDEAYEKILDRIPTTEIVKAKKILRLILAAERDLSLTELKIASTVASDGSYAKLDKRDETNVRIFSESIRTTCGLLIRVAGSQVFLIHQTAREFLTKSLRNEGLTCLPWRNSFSTSEIHLDLAQSCIWYLNSSSFDQDWFKQDAKGQWNTIGPLSKYKKQHPFVEYAARYWPLHLLHSGADATHPLTAAASQLCEVDTPRYRAWSKVYWSHLGRKPPRSTTALAVAAAFDLLPVMEAMLNAGKDINAQDGDGDTALHSAALHGQERAAIALINRGAALDVRAHDGNLPIHSAAARGLADAAKLMIDHGSTTEERNQELRTPLHRAALWGHPGVVDVLIDAVVSVNVLDVHGRSPLHLAALFGRDDIKRGHSGKIRAYSTVIKRLVRAGADRTLVDREGKTALDVGLLTVEFFTNNPSDMSQMDVDRMAALVRKQLLV